MGVNTHFSMDQKTCQQVILKPLKQIAHLRCMPLLYIFFIQLLLLFLVLVYFSSYSYSPLFVLILSFTFFSFCHILNVDILSFCFFFSISKGLLQVFKCYIDIVCCVVTYHTDMCECLLSIIFSAIWKWTCVKTAVRFPGKKN